MDRFMGQGDIVMKIMSLMECSLPCNIKSPLKRDQVNLHRSRESIGHLRTQFILITSHIMEVRTW